MWAWPETNLWIPNISIWFFSCVSMINLPGLIPLKQPLLIWTFSFLTSSYKSLSWIPSKVPSKNLFNKIFSKKCMVSGNREKLVKKDEPEIRKSSIVWSSFWMIDWGSLVSIVRTAPISSGCRNDIDRALLTFRRYRNFAGRVSVSRCTAWNRSSLITMSVPKTLSYNERDAQQSSTIT